MQSSIKRHTKASKRLSLVFIYLPFLLMQLSYKFFIVANLYFYSHHQSQLVLKVDLSHEQQTNSKKGGHEKPGYYVSHLSIDKRYSHKVFSNDAELSYATVSAPQPFSITIERSYCIENVQLVFSSQPSSTSRGPPQA